MNPFSRIRSARRFAKLSNVNPTYDTSTKSPLAALITSFSSASPFLMYKLRLSSLSRITTRSKTCFVAAQDEL